jgi:C-1 hydroxylase
MGLNRTTFDRAIAAWNAGDLEGYLELYDPDVALHGYSDRPMPLEEVRGFYQGVWTAIADPRITVHQVAEADDWVWCRATMSGTHAGEFFGVPATGRSVAQPVMTALRFVDGRCVERHSVADMLPVLLQIGALTPPG